MIPRRIVTTWLTHSSMGLADAPAIVKNCVASQRSFCGKQGYDHVVLDAGSVVRGVLPRMGSKTADYILAAYQASKFTKASDVLRMQYMYEYGGIYLDADMEVLPSATFDDLLDNWFFTSFECAGLYANAGFGCEAGHPLLRDYIDRVVHNYTGTGDLVFEPGIRTFHDIFWAVDKARYGVTMIPTEVFFPYNHLTGAKVITDKTKVIHHYMKSWKT